MTGAPIIAGGAAAEPAAAFTAGVLVPMVMGAPPGVAVPALDGVVGVVAVGVVVGAVVAGGRVAVAPVPAVACGVVVVLDVAVEAGCAG